ncbi:MAG: sulfite exporter TauE/SafE family protein [Oscillospiraceae bacterium]|nr:sulfite exporter TauE/SafE family protein [Oscillospiraceae bacterium]
MAITLFLIAVLTSVIGSICGIGGGVIIKPVLDSLNIMSVSAVSFLSGCSVLAMAFISVGKSVRSGRTKINKKITPPLAVGAAVGGVAGKLMFTVIKQSAGNENLVGLVQSVVLMLITIATFAYMYLRNNGKIETRHVRSASAGIGIGLVLGILSSFLGIGGGPINLAVLSYFFSMDTKESATNSLFIILLSQITSLIQSAVSASIPEVNILFLCAMIGGGVLGGFIGQTVNKRLSDRQVELLFNILLMVVTGICIYNAARFGIAL